MEQKVLLLNLPNDCTDRKFFCLPLGLAYLASALENDFILNGIDLAATKEKNVTCYLNAPKKYLDEILNFSPDYVLISCLTNNRFNVFYWAETIKKYLKKAKVIIGGHFATFKCEEILLNIPSIDYVVMGEGENIVIKLLKGIENNNIKEINNICFRDSSGKIIKRKNENLCDINKIDIPKRNIFKDKYIARLGEKEFPHVASILGTRGCPMSCNFCSSRAFWEKSYRLRNIEGILDEIKQLKKEGFDTFMFVDDNFTINEKHLVEFCERIVNERINIKWICWGSLNINPKILDIMQEAGCIFISFGLESASPMVLRSLKKNININHSKQVLKKCKKIEMDFRITLIFNSGYETIESLKETFNFLSETQINIEKIDYSLDGLFVYPGTDLEKEFFNKKNKAFDWFKPTNQSYVVKTDYLGNHIIPLFNNSNPNLKKLAETWIKNGKR